MTLYYECPRCGSESLERIYNTEDKYGMDNYPEITEHCDLCGFTDVR